MSDSPQPRTRIPPADALLPLPEAALRLVQLARDWLPWPLSRDADYLARAEVVNQAHAVAGLIGRAQQEMVPGIGPCVAVVRGWENDDLVLCCVNRLADAVRALLDDLGWAGLWGADGYSMASEGIRCGGKLLSEAGPAPGWAVIVESKSFCPVPAALLDAVEQAARLLYRELRPTIALMNAESSPPGAPKSPPKKPSKLATAMALLKLHPEWTVGTIASHAGCNPKYLSQREEFTAARKVVKEIGRRELVRGGKAKDGSMEAEFRPQKRKAKDGSMEARTDDD